MSVLRVENVFLQANYVPDLFTLAVVGLILGTFIFSAIADFFGRKLSFYVGSATVIVFTLCMVPTDFNFHLFAFFKVSHLIISNPQNDKCCFCSPGCRCIWHVAPVPVPDEHFVRDLQREQEGLRHLRGLCGLVTGTNPHASSW